MCASMNNVNKLSRSRLVQTKQSGDPKTVALTVPRQHSNTPLLSHPSTQKTGQQSTKEAFLPWRTAPTLVLAQPLRGTISILLTRSSQAISCLENIRQSVHFVNGVLPRPRRHLYFSLPVDEEFGVFLDCLVLKAKCEAFQAF